MHPTTTAPRCCIDPPTVKLNALDTSIVIRPPLQANANIINKTDNDPLQRLQNLSRKRTTDLSPQGVRRATLPASGNIGAENRILFEQKRTVKQIATYNELRLLGIPADRIMLDPHTNHYVPPNQSLKTMVMGSDAPTLALRMLNGGNPNEQDEYGTPALVTAAAHGKVNAVRILAGAGADINARDANQRTPLLAASAAGHAATVIALLPYQPDLDATDGQGMTALMHTCVHGHQTAARLLLAKGANAGISTADGSTARQLAVRHGHHDIFEDPVPMEDIHDNSKGESGDIAMQ